MTASGSPPSTSGKASVVADISTNTDSKKVVFTPLAASSPAPPSASPIRSGSRATGTAPAPAAKAGDPGGAPAGEHPPPIRQRRYLTLVGCGVPGTRSVNSHHRFAFSRRTAVACPAASSHVPDCRPPTVNRRYLLSVLVDEPAEDPGQARRSQPDSGGDHRVVAKREELVSLAGMAFSAVIVRRCPESRDTGRRPGVPR